MLKQNCACKVGFYILFFFFFGLSWLISLQFIQYHVAGFYKPTIPQSSTLPFSGLQHMQQCQVRVFHKFLWKALIQMNGAWKMVSTVGVWTQDLSVMSLLPQPLDHGYSPLVSTYYVFKIIIKQIEYLEIFFSTNPKVFAFLDYSKECPFLHEVVKSS